MGSNTPGRRKRRRVQSGVRQSDDGRRDGERAETISFLCPRPKIRLGHIGGIDNTIQTIRELTEWPLFHRELYSHLGVDPPRGILLHGPPGCGKTLLAHGIAGELGVSFLKVSGPEIVSSMSGESERKLRNLFAEARRLSPSIIFVDEIDVIASRKDGATKDMERRIVSQLISCIDEGGGNTEDKPSEAAPEHTGGPVARPEEPVKLTADGSAGEPADAGSSEAPVATAVLEPSSFIVIASTSRPESIEPALRRAGRFDREIELGAPDEVARRAICQSLLANSKLQMT